MDNSVTLWQFLLQLLLDRSQEELICWTNQEGEFKLLQAEEVAKLWGARKNKPNMNYDKLSRALRYYYEKNIIKKVNGQKFVYRFVSYPDILRGELASRAEGAGEGGVGGALFLMDRSPCGLQKEESKNGGVEKPGIGGGGGGGGSGCGVVNQLGKTTGRNDYIHSGLYTTFTLTSLQSGTQLFKSIKIENPGEKLTEKKPSTDLQQPSQIPTPTQTPFQTPNQSLTPTPSPQQLPPHQSSSPSSVIRFGTIPCSLSSTTATAPVLAEKPKRPPTPPQTSSPRPVVQLHPSQPATALSDTESPSGQLALFSSTSTPFEEPLPINSPISVFNLVGLSSSSPSPNAPSSNAPEDSSQELVIDTDMESISSQTMEPQSQGQAVSSLVPLTATQESGGEVQLSLVRRPSGSRARKPKGLELMPTLVVTSSDLSPLGLSSPSLPTASLTPAFLQTPTLLLTPSPLSNIHFWSTLSPVAPLSPARRLGAHTLFQFPTSFNTPATLPIHSLDGTTTPGPLSPDPPKT